MFVLGRTYRRRDLHVLYGGQQQGGISTPAQRTLIMLFTGAQGHQYGYRDGWTEDGVFLYTGEGQLGNMRFVRGNRAIRDHSFRGKELHLFECVHPRQVRYIGEVIFTGFNWRRAPDRDGKERDVIVFELTPIEEFTNAGDELDTSEADLWRKPLPKLREEALATPQLVERSPAERKRQVYHRSSAVRIYVLRRAEGLCERCGNPAPFKTAAGRMYLEPHHLRRLSDGGPDHPRWVAALCPNCHRRAHYGADRHELNTKLSDELEREEGAVAEADG